MTIVLFRVDERLIHGQVVMGWGPALHPDHFVVVDDELSESAWEQDLYRLGLSEGSTVEFLSVADARDRLEDWATDERSTMVLTRSVSAMVGLAEGGGLKGREVNLGGVYHSPGRTERLPYVFLDSEDEAQLRSLEERGVAVSARALPSSRAVSLASLLS